MGWTTPITWVASQVVTAAQMNALRDNLLETAPAKATTAGGIFVATGSNSIAQRLISDDVVDTSEASSSTAYTSLTTNGPQVTVTSGAKALVFLNAHMSNTTIGQTTYASFQVSGATTIAASDSRSLYVEPSDVNRAIRAGISTLIATTSGSNTFQMLYRVAGGTGTFYRRRMIVIPL